MSNVQFLHLEFDLGDSDFRYLVEEHPLKITNCRHENWRDFLFAATNKTTLAFKEGKKILQRV